MSALSIPTTLPALPAVITQPHGHGHRKGIDLNASDASSSTAAQIPVGSAPNLFGSLISTLEQVIGIQPPAAPNAAQLAATTAAGTPGPAGSKINVLA